MLAGRLARQPLAWRAPSCFLTLSRQFASDADSDSSHIPTTKSPPLPLSVCRLRFLAFSLRPRPSRHLQSGIDASFFCPALSLSRLLPTSSLCPPSAVTHASPVPTPAMLRSRHASRAIRALGQTRTFTSTTAPVAGRAAKKIPSGQRNQATAATATSSAAP